MAECNRTGCRHQGCHEAGHTGVVHDAVHVAEDHGAQVYCHGVDGYRCIDVLPRSGRGDVSLPIAVALTAAGFSRHERRPGDFSWRYPPVGP